MEGGQQFFGAPNFNVTPFTVQQHYEATTTPPTRVDTPAQLNASFHFQNTQESLPAQQSTPPDSSDAVVPQSTRKRKAAFEDAISRKLARVAPELLPYYDPLPPEDQWLLEDIDCFICFETYHPAEGVIKAYCGHFWCRSCVEHRFRSAIDNETLYPPRCCEKRMTVTLVEDILPQSLIAEFLGCQEEYEIEMNDRTYCQHCRAFIRPFFINGTLAICMKCFNTTCTTCRERWHIQKCTTSNGEEELNLAAEDNLWRNCPKCRVRVELAKGCIHIICYCKHEFCYVCGKVWRQCECRKLSKADQFEKARQLDQNFQPITPEQRRRQAYLKTTPTVFQPRKKIQLANGCRHEELGTYRGAHGQELVCGICGDTRLTWIRQCKQCKVFLCTECKNERV